MYLLPLLLSFADKLSCSLHGYVTVWVRHKHMQMRYTGKKRPIKANCNTQIFTGSRRLMSPRCKPPLNQVDMMSPFQRWVFFSKQSFISSGVPAWQQNSGVFRPPTEPSGLQGFTRYILDSSQEEEGTEGAQAGRRSCAAPVSLVALSSLDLVGQST